LTRLLSVGEDSYLPAYIVAIEGDKAKEAREEQSRLVDDNGLKYLQAICATKIRQAAIQETLLRHPRLAELLGLWKAWSPSDEPSEWIRTLIDSPDGLLSFLVASLHETRSQTLGSYTVQSKWQIDLQFVERFIAPELVESKLTGLSGRQLQDKEEQAVRAFHKAMKRKREGKQGLSRFAEE
jgi:predicted KAP-like P-loop ATPase